MEWELVVNQTLGDATTQEHEFYFIPEINYIYRVTKTSIYGTITIYAMSRTPNFPDFPEYVIADDIQKDVPYLIPLHNGRIRVQNRANDEKITSFILERKYNPSPPSNTPPVLTLKTQNGNIISDNKSFAHFYKNDFLFKITVNSEDGNDTFQYMVTVRGNTIIDYTNINKNTEKTITIPSNSLIDGNNQVFVIVKNNNNITTSKIFNIKSFRDMSLRGVYNIINS